MIDEKRKIDCVSDDVGCIGICDDGDGLHEYHCV
jgi:hypothetical protein